MTKSTSSNPGEQIKSIPFNGDLYHCYHINGVVTEIRVRWDNMGRDSEPIEWADLSPQLQNLIDDSINFGDKK